MGQPSQIGSPTQQSDRPDWGGRVGTIRPQKLLQHHAVQTPASGQWHQQQPQVANVAGGWEPENELGNTSKHRRQHPGGALFLIKNPNKTGPNELLVHFPKKNHCRGRPHPVEISSFFATVTAQRSKRRE
jgi:hypothetical protein